MLMTHVTLRHKSSFSYLPPLLTRSAIVTTHTVSPRLLLFHLLQNTERQKLPISVWPESSCFSVFSRARCYGQHFLAFWVQKCFSSSCHSESLSVEWLSESPTDAALQLPDHISLSLKNTSVHLTPLPQPVSKESSEFQRLENRNEGDLR